MTRRGVLALALLISAGGSARATELTFDLAIVQGRVAEAMRLIRITQGDTVRLRWTSDRALNLHLHGYDIERRVMPGTVAEMTFTARATGRFAIHIHAPDAPGGPAHDDAPLAVVEVYPR